MGGRSVGAGDEIVISAMEHHSNIVPWQILCEQTGRPAPHHSDHRCRRAAISTRTTALLTDRTRIVAVVHVSNALGTVNPVEEIVRVAHERGIPVLVDGAQAVAHGAVDVQALGCDFYAFSGHKMFGPTGIGVLYGPSALLEAMPPYQSGGDMIRSVSFEQTMYNVAAAPIRSRHAGHRGSRRPGGGDRLSHRDRVRTDRPLRAGAARVCDRRARRDSGRPRDRHGRAKAGVLSFVLDGVHPHDVGDDSRPRGRGDSRRPSLLPAVDGATGLSATARASLALYNTREDIDALAAAVAEVRELFG